MSGATSASSTGTSATSSSTSMSSSSSGGGCEGKQGKAGTFHGQKIDVEIKYRDGAGKVHEEKQSFEPGWHTLALGWPAVLGLARSKLMNRRLRGVGG